MNSGSGRGGRHGLWLRTPTAGDLVDICRDMCAADAAEIFALRRHDDRYRLAMEIYAVIPSAIRALAIGLDSEPAAKAFLAIWAMDETGTLAAAHLFGTDQFPRIGNRLVRYARDILIPEMLAAGMRRVEARVMASHTRARAFLKACGAVEETHPPHLVGMGCNGEAYVMCAWRRSDWS